MLKIRKHMLVSLVIVLSMILISTTTVLAASPAEAKEEAVMQILFTVDSDGDVTIIKENNGTTVGMNTVAITDISKDDQGIGPNVGIQKITVVGNVGSATITWITPQQIYWKIAPNSGYSSCTFSGKITIKNIDTGKTAKTIDLIGSSNGSSISNNEFFQLTRYKTYLATLSGGGTLTKSGKVSAWAVGSGCHETKYANY